MDPTKSPFLPITPTKSGRSGADENINIGISTEFLNKEIKKIERGVSTEMGRVLHHELDMLHRRLTEDKRVEETREGVRTETVLRLVSTALNENVEKSLGRIITDNMQRSVIPALQTVTKQVIEHHVTRVIERRLTDTIAQNLGAWMNREMQTHFPNAVAQAMQNQDALRMMTDGIANKVAARLNTENTKHAAQIADLNAKLEQLTTLMRGSVDAVTTMAAAQSQFQEEVLKLQRQIGEGTNDTDPEENQLTPLAVSSRENASRDTTSREDTQSPTIRSQQPAKSPEEIELAEITELMTEGSYQDGSIKWLRSERASQLFDEFFVQCSPAFLSSLPPILALSVGVVITQTFDTNTSERLGWLETILTIVNFDDVDIQEISPEIMDKVIGRLESFYMQVAEINPQNIILRKIPPLTRRAREIKTAARRANAQKN